MQARNTNFITSDITTQNIRFQSLVGEISTFTNIRNLNSKEKDKGTLRYVSLFHLVAHLEFFNEKKISSCVFVHRDNSTR